MSYIIPWEVRKGTSTLTEKGIYEGNISHITFFQKLFTGKDAVIATWSNSTKLVKPKRQDGEYGKEDPRYWENNFYKYQFRKGYYLIGTPISGQNQRGVDFENSKVNEDMITMKSTNSWTMRFDFQPSTLLQNNAPYKRVSFNFSNATDIKNHWDLLDKLEEEDALSHSFLPKREDMFKFYTIPELNEDEWLYISRVSYFFENMGSKICATEVTFSSVNDLIQTSGKAQEQYIQCGAIGEPYCTPKLSVNEDGEVELDYEIIEPQRARWLQIDYQGPCGLTNIIVMGREIYKDEEGNWCTKAPKQLLFNRFGEPKINEFNKNSLPTKNYYLFTNTKLLWETSKNLMETWKQLDNVIAQNSYASAITLGATTEWTDFIHNSNPLSGTPQTHTPYTDADWHPISNNKAFSNIGCPYCADTITYWTTDNMIQILNKNSFVFSSQEIIPASFYSTFPYKVSDIPLIGGFVAKLIGDRTLNPNIRRRYTFELMMFLGCDIGSMLKSIPNDEQRDEVRSFVGLLNGKEDAPKSLGLNSSLTSFLVELTDKYQIYDNGQDVVIDTELLGQVRNPDGTFIHQDQSKLVFQDAENHNAKPKMSENYFVIDAVISQAIFNGNIRITAYSGTNAQEPLWAETICANTKWRDDSYVDWTSVIYTGGWSDIWTERQDEMTWPETPEMMITSPFIPINESMEEVSANKDCSNTVPNYFISEWKQDGTTTSSLYSTLDLTTKTWYNQRTKDIYMSYHDFDGTITTKQEFINKYAGKTLQVQIEGAVSEHHHDIFYNADFGTQTPNYYEIHLDENGEVKEQEVAVFGKNRSDCLTNFAPYETDIYFDVVNHATYRGGGENQSYGTHQVLFTVQITFELFDNEMIVRFRIRDYFYWGNIENLPPRESDATHYIGWTCNSGVGRTARMNTFYLNIKNIIFPTD